MPLPQFLVPELLELARLIPVTRGTHEVRRQLAHALQSTASTFGERGGEHLMLVCGEMGEAHNALTGVGTQWPSLSGAVASAVTLPFDPPCACRHGVRHRNPASAAHVCLGRTALPACQRPSLRADRGAGAPSAASPEGECRGLGARHARGSQAGQASGEGGGVD